VKSFSGIVCSGFILYLISCVLRDPIAVAIWDFQHDSENGSDFGVLCGVCVLVVLYFIISETLSRPARAINGIILPLCLLWACGASTVV
jgi:uncharacterized membrane protein